MSQMVLVQAEVDQRTKVSAEKWLENQGIGPADAIRLFYQEVVACHGLPFSGRTGTADEASVAEEEASPFAEVSATTIPSVSGEMHEAQVHGGKMLDLLKEFRKQRATAG